MFAFSHAQTWGSIDLIATNNSISVSALARRAGLDATAFNKSKRISPQGRERWPSTETISKILHAVGMTVEQWVAIMQTIPADTKTVRIETPIVSQKRTRAKKAARTEEAA